MRRQTCWCLSSLLTPWWRHWWQHWSQSTPATQDLHQIKVTTTRPARQLTSDPEYCWLRQVRVLVIPQITGWQVSSDQLTRQMKWALTVDIEVCYGGTWFQPLLGSIIMLSDSHWELSPSLPRQFSWSTCKHGYCFWVIIKTVVSSW